MGEEGRWERRGDGGEDGRGEMGEGRWERRDEEVEIEEEMGERLERRENVRGGWKVVHIRRLLWSPYLQVEEVS